MDFCQGCQDHSVEKRIAFQQMMLEQLNDHMQKHNWIPVSYHVQYLTQNESKT